MIGIRTGLRVGLAAAAAASVGVDELGGGGSNPYAGITKDATANIYTPASSGEWSSFLSAAGLSGSVSVPSSLWLCQEAAGNLTDSIGALTLTAANTPLYQQTASGWTRKGVSFTDGSTARFSAASGVGPNPTTTSAIWLWFVTLPAVPGTNRVVAGYTSNATKPLSTLLLSTGKARLNASGVNADGTAAPASKSHPWTLKYNRTGGETKLFTIDEKIVGTYDAVGLDGAKGIGAFTGTACAAVAVYGCMWSGTAGEMSDATIKALLQALGWAIPWS